VDRRERPPRSACDDRAACGYSGRLSDAGYRPIVSTSPGRNGTRMCSPGMSGGSMVHGLGCHFEPSGSSLKLSSP
jgi:hypothetical protein